MGLLGSDRGGHSEKVEVDSTGTGGVEIKILANGGSLRDGCEEIYGCVKT